MKRITVLSIIGLFFIIGCGPKPPVWVPVHSPAEDAFYGVGQSSKRSPTLSKKTATERARTEIAGQIEAKVSYMLKDFLEQRGFGEDSDALEWTQYVGKTVSSLTMKGSVVQDGWYNDRKKEYWIVVEYPIGEARQLTREKARQDLLQREALRQKLEAQKALEDMDREIDKMDAYPPPSSP